jgi:molecular chaperone DnaK
MVDYSNIPRDSRRVPLETRVQFKFDRFSGFLSDFSANVSPGGMFIRTRTPQPAGTVLEFEFRLGDGFELIRGRGEVVWTRAEDEGPARPAGMGLRFLELSQGSKELIYRIVDHHIQQGGTPFDVTQGPPDPIPPPPAPAPLPPLPPLRFDPAPTPPPAAAAPSPRLTPSPLPPPPSPQAPPAPSLAPPAGGWEPENSKLWLPSLEEEPGGFDPSPYAPPLAAPDDWMKARQALPKESFSEPAAGAPEPGPAHDHPAAGPLFGASLEPEPSRHSRRALPWILVGVLVALAAGAYLFRDTLLGLAGLGGDEGAENLAQATPPTVKPRHLRSRALPSASPAPTAAAPMETPVETPARPPAPIPKAAPAPAASVPVAAAKPAPAAAVAAPAPTTATLPPSSKTGPQGEKPAPLPAVREDTGPAATGVDKITFEKAFGGTDIILWGNGAIRSRTYVRSRIEGNPPRELIRLSGIKRPAPAARLAVGTPEVLQVRTGLHAGDELHVVLDLAGPKVTVTGIEEGENRLRIHLQKQ